MTTSRAAFTISGSPSSPRGYDAAPSTTLILQLEAQPSPDVSFAQYSLVALTKNAPAVTIASGGIPSPPTAAINFTIGAGVHAYWLRCTVSIGDGSIPIGADGKPDYAQIQYDRIVLVRAGNGTAKILPGETFQYSAPDGWVGRFNELVDAGDAGAGALTGLHFPDSAVVVLDQDNAQPGTPSDMTIQAQGAAVGHPARGANLILQSGKSGDAANYGGDIVLDVRDQDDNNPDAGSVVFKAGTFGEWLSCQMTSGNTVIDCPTALTLVLSCGDQSIQLADGIATNLNGKVGINGSFALGTGSGGGAGTVVINWSTSNRKAVNQTGNITFAPPTGQRAGAPYFLEIHHNGGTIAFDLGAGGWRFPGAAQPTLTLTNGTVSVLQFLSDGTVCRASASPQTNM